jgi:hypothetical protein
MPGYPRSLATCLPETSRSGRMVGPAPIASKRLQAPSIQRDFIPTDDARSTAVHAHAALVRPANSECNRMWKRLKLKQRRGRPASRCDGACEESGVARGQRPRLASRTTDRREARRTIFRSSDVLFNNFCLSQVAFPRLKLWGVPSILTPVPGANAAPGVSSQGVLAGWH